MCTPHREREGRECRRAPFLILASYLPGWAPAAPSGNPCCPKQPEAAEMGAWALHGFCHDQNKSFKAVLRGEFEVTEKQCRRRRKKCVHGSEEVGEGYVLWASIPCLQSTESCSWAGYKRDASVSAYKEVIRDYCCHITCRDICSVAVLAACAVVSFFPIFFPHAPRKKNPFPHWYCVRYVETAVWSLISLYFSPGRGKALASSSSYHMFSTTPATMMFLCSNWSDLPWTGKPETGHSNWDRALKCSRKAKIYFWGRVGCSCPLTDNMW